MPILVDSSSKVLFQGVNTESDLGQLQQSISYGTKVVGVISPKKSGEEVLGVPTFATVAEARRKTGCTTTVLFQPIHEMKEGLLESIYASVPLIICLLEKLPLHDMVDVFQTLKKFPNVRLIGPNSFGLITPRQCKIGRMPGYLFMEGCVGILSSSSNLLYEAALQLNRKNLGQSTCIVQGSYPLVATRWVDFFDMFYRDAATEVLLFLGSIDPAQEEESIEWVRKNTLKPFIAFLTGQENNTLRTRVALAKAGAHVVEDLSLLGERVYAIARPLA